MTRPTFMAITSTGGYIGRVIWHNTGIYPDHPHWGSVGLMPVTILGSWAGSIPTIRQIINWRFYEPD